MKSCLQKDYYFTHFEELNIPLYDLTTHTHTAYYVEKLLHLFLTMLFAAPRYKILFLFFLKTSSRIIIINESQIEVKVVIGKEKVVYRRKIWFFNIDYFVIP